MSAIDDLYQEVILDHNKRPRNYQTLPDANRTAKGYNPLCGDQLTLYLEMNGDVIKNIGFQGSGCAISKASASLMTDSVKGMSPAEAQTLFENFRNMVTGGDFDMDSLGKLAVFSGVCEFPARVKCASLAWHTLRTALEGHDGVATTESSEKEPSSTDPEVRQTEKELSKDPEIRGIELGVVDALRTCYDPEIPVNIYDLGLIYDVDVKSDKQVHIKMTLTSPMCPVAESLPPEVEDKARSVYGVVDAKVDVVWEPPWNPGMMTEDARLELGMFQDSMLTTTTPSVLTDRYGRTITDLRISITARCNFACLYCHNEGQGPVQSLSAPVDEMSVEEITQVGRVAAGFGIHDIKLSGGEPLARRDCEDIVARLAEFATVSLVTNGSLLASRAAGLRDAGLSRINVSLDAMDPVVFREVRRGHLRPVLEGIHQALAVGLSPVKLNMVVFKRTIQGMPDILEFVRQHAGLVLQLIQYMPEIAGHEERAVAIGEVRRFLEEQSDSVEIRSMHHRRVYHLGGARVELVDPVGNREFCAFCQRLRVTANGHLKGCLNRSDDEVSLRHLPDAGVREVFKRVTESRMPFYPYYVQSRQAAAR